MAESMQWRAASRTGTAGRHHRSSSTSRQHHHHSRSYDDVHMYQPAWTSAPSHRPPPAASQYLTSSRSPQQQPVIINNRVRRSSYSDDGQDDVFAWAHPNEVFKLAPTDPGGFRDLFLNECLQLLDMREREFGEFRILVRQLEAMVRSPFLACTCATHSAVSLPNETWPARVP
jgi:hypothetical protein